MRRSRGAQIGWVGQEIGPEVGKNFEMNGRFFCKIKYVRNFDFSKIGRLDQKQKSINVWQAKWTRCWNWII